MSADSLGLASTQVAGHGPSASDGTTDVEFLARGSTVGRYLVLERLGAGAMGIVYAAYDPELERKIALKLLLPQETEGDQPRRQARMVREAQAIAKVSHPNVVAIFDVGVHEGHVFMAMEHLSGGTLRDWVTSKKPSWREIVKKYVVVGQGLAAAHSEGLIHRDFKPDNVLLDKNGLPKVLDFGLVRLAAVSRDKDLISSEGVDRQQAVAEPNVERKIAPAVLKAADGGPAALTRTGALTGTPAYMAPEQFLSQRIDARTDQFAFCVALYEALYGERPFAGASVIALAESVINGRVQPPPKNTLVPGWVRGCLLRGLKTNPVQRYAGLDELVAALSNDPARRTRKLAFAGAALAAVLGAAGVAHRMGASQPPMCTGGPTRLAGIWAPGAGGAERQTAIHRAFAASGKSYAEKAYAGVARLFDQYVGRWTTMYTEACEATHVRGEQSAEVLDLRMSCLSERLGNARALSDVLAAADGKVVENAVSAAAALPSLDRCADVPLLRAVVKPPEDAPTRKRVDELRIELNRFIALRDSGQCAQATLMAAPLIDQSRATAHQPLLAEALFASAQLGNHCGDDPQMLQRFREAHAVASASHYDDVAAQAAALIPSFAINRLGEVTVAREWLGVAEGAAARLGRETLASAMLAQAEGMLAVTNKDYSRALAAADRSIDITRRLLGADDPLTIAWEANKGDWEVAAGQLKEALATDVSARGKYERVLGHEHPRVAIVLNNEGEVLNLLGRPAEAEAAYGRAIQLFRQSGADEDLLVWALTGVGRAHLGAGHPGEAIGPLEEALAMLIDKHARAALQGETRFALARALWSRPGDRRRAVELAVSARDDLHENEKAVAEIDGWLTAAQAEKRSQRVRPESKTRRTP